VHEKKQKSSIDANKRIISKSKDGTKERVYRQCSHTECKNIAKKFGVCYSHGAPCSMKSRRKNLQSKTFMDMVVILINGVEDEEQYWVLSLQLQNADDPRLRWVALEMLKKGVGMYGSGGWTAERREHLKLFQLDLSVDVSAAAGWVFPPSE